MTFKKNIFIITAVLVTAVFIWGTPGFSTYARSKPEKSEKYKLRNLVQYVNPFCGTTHYGNTYPGASAPFGMIQWSPDTGPEIRRGGYNYLDSLIYGFSLDHISGAGCYYAGNFAFMPVLNSVKIMPPKDRYAFFTQFSHKNEAASPGYYSVMLDNKIKVELTATERSGFGRFIYPEKGQAIMTVNAGSSTRDNIISSIYVNPAEHSVSGTAAGGSFCGEISTAVVYFYAVFSKPFTSFNIWNCDSLLDKGNCTAGINTGTFLSFNLGDDKTLLAKVGISYVSMANAKANAEKESPLPAFTAKDFDEAKDKISDKWNKWLNKIQIDGAAEDEKKTFYSMMYHTFLGPTICSDVNGEYFGYDGRIHTTEPGRTQYSSFSGWDIYRTQCQFIGMIAPKEASDMAQSLLNDYKQGGAFPRWGLPNMDSGVMMGDPAAPIIAGYYAFGARDFSTKEALSGLIRAAVDPKVRAPRAHTYERDALADYLKLGYVPEHQKGGYGNVSMTLEYASADFALSEFAKALGDSSSARMLLKQAQNWKNHFNPETSFLQMRRRDGSWAPGIADSLPVYDGERAYVEGTAEQYLWMVPFNLKGLTELLGGAGAAENRLDRFFTHLNAGDLSKYANLGNEPTSQTPWIYNFIGKPFKTQALVRRVLQELYSYKPDGLPGNDDLGTMGAWYIWSALGMYPVLPGSDILVLGSPLYPEAVIHLENADIKVRGKNAGKNCPYVHGIKVNGKDWSKTWLRFGNLSKGAELQFKLGAEPDTGFGSGPSDIPPSYE